MSVTDRHRQLMRHALGLDRSSEPYRNHYVTPETTDTAGAWRELIAMGFATVEPQSGMALYRVSEAGKKALGLEPPK